MKKRIFSGAQPTGHLHIGNYLGALKNWVALQDEYEAFYCIVNLHAITLPQNPAELRQKTLDLARIYLAAGVDPEKSTIFIQSDVPEHAELTWILSCISRMGELERMTQFKDKTKIKEFDNESLSQFFSSQEFQQYGEENEVVRHFVKEIQAGKITASNLRGHLEIFIRLRSFFETQESEQENYSPPMMRTFLELLIQVLSSLERERAGVGLFTYPLLMASDILLYQTDLVPVGQDQKQHLELCRDLAERFNRDFGETFKIPEPYIPKMGASIKSLQDPSKKMSKSDENANGSIFLLDDADTITKKIKRAVTDSGTDITFDETRPAITNLLTIYQLITDKSQDECVAHFAGKGYGDFKGELAEATVEFLKPFQERIKQFGDEKLKSILSTGAEKAKAVASETLKTVYQRTGLK
jgi:tryptophanyl-tRNA synthetase